MERLSCRWCSGAQILHVLLCSHGIGCEQQLAHTPLHFRFRINPNPPQVRIARREAIGSGHHSSASARRRWRLEYLPIKPRFAAFAAIRTIPYDHPLFVWR